MATVTITLTDHPAGHVEVHIAGLPAAGEIPTKAQAFGAGLREAINGLKPCISGMGHDICCYCDETCTQRNAR